MPDTAAAYVTAHIPADRRRALMFALCVSIGADKPTPASTQTYAGDPDRRHWLLPSLAMAYQAHVQLDRAEAQPCPRG